MKLRGTVNETKTDAGRLLVRVKAEKLPGESEYVTVTHDIEMPDTTQARRTYFVGRKVVMDIKPD